VKFCEKKQKRCADHAGDVAGDLWDHTAVAADSKLVVSRVVGKRPYEEALAFGQDTKTRLRRGH
jgi:hypothetical protein